MITTLIVAIIVTAQTFLAVRTPITLAYMIRTHRSQIGQTGPRATVPRWLRWLATSTPMRLLSLAIAALACSAALVVAIIHPSP